MNYTNHSKKKKSIFKYDICHRQIVFQKPAKKEPSVWSKTALGRWDIINLFKWILSKMPKVNSKVNILVLP